MQNHFIAFKTILIKEFLRFIRIWIQTIIPPMVTVGLYFIIFGNLIGSRLGKIDGFSYMEYIAPGLIMMAVITNSYSNVVSSFFSSKFHRHIEEMLVSPMPNYIIILGFVAGGMARGGIVGLAVMGVSILFIEINIFDILIMILVILLTALLFSLGGLINGVFARSFDDVSIVPTFVLTPLTYLGGIFYSIEMLPDFWQQASKLNPILYIVNTFRYGMLGITDISLGMSFAIICGFCLLLYLWSLYLLNKGVGIKN
ncbi:MAG: ABC transporter permease [Pseudomonadota bacterium]